MRQDRLDHSRVRLAVDADLDVILYANPDVPIDRQGLREVENLAALTRTLEDLARTGFFGGHEARLERVVLTPDFHKGAGIPIGSVLDARGFVLPKCVGSDIGCGMRLISTDVSEQEIEQLGEQFDRIVRHVFFEGGRDIGMDERRRTAILSVGALGLLEGHGGGEAWRWIDEAQWAADLDRHHQAGSWQTAGVIAPDGFLSGAGGISRDDQLGSIGGGNHFVEVQLVDEMTDGQTAWDWGLRPGQATIMVHTGSVSVGRYVGNRFTDRAAALYPGCCRRPDHGYFPLPVAGPHACEGEAYLSAMANAANFAVANRTMLGLMMVRCLSEALGRRIGHRLVWDAPHNLAWRGADDRVLHRKGACPADRDVLDPTFPDGHPVIVPGSMGDFSWLLKGQGDIGSLCSAPHGAGRVVARGEARVRDGREMAGLHVIGRLDPRGQRSDVADEIRRTLMEEAPSMYKPVTPVMETVRDAGVATPVARLRPCLTVKG